MMGIGLRELLFIALVVILLFGARKIPSIMADFAKGIRSFRKGLNDPDGKDEPKDTEDPPRQITHSGVREPDRTKQPEA